MYTPIYKTDSQHGPTYSTGNHPQYFVTIYKGKEYENNTHTHTHTHTHIYVYTPESLCCTYETNTTL